MKGMLSKFHVAKKSKAKTLNGHLIWSKGTESTFWRVLDNIFRMSLYLKDQHEPKMGRFKAKRPTSCDFLEMSSSDFFVGLLMKGM